MTTVREVLSRLAVDLDGNPISEDSREVRYVHRIYASIVEAESDPGENMEPTENAGFKAGQKRDKYGRWGAGAAHYTVTKGEFKGQTLPTLTLKGHKVVKKKIGGQEVDYAVGGRWVTSTGKKVPAYAQKLADIRGRNLTNGWKTIHVSENPKAAVPMRGTDSKGRPQIHQSKEKVSKQAARKFGNLDELFTKIPSIEKQVGRDVKNPATKEVASCFRLIMNIGNRPGGSDTKAAHKSYGATTLQGRHVKQMANGEVYLRFVPGKNKGKEISMRIRDNPALQKELLARSKKAGPKGNLFEGVTAAKLNKYTDTLDGGKFTPRNFRTLVCTKRAINLVNQVKRLPKTEKELKNKIAQVLESIKKDIGHTTRGMTKRYVNDSVFAPWRINVDKHSGGGGATPAKSSTKSKPSKQEFMDSPTGGKSLAKTFQSISKDEGWTGLKKNHYQAIAQLNPKGLQGNTLHVPKGLAGDAKEELLGMLHKSVKLKFH